MKINLHKIREELGYSVEEFADAAGLKPTTYKKHEKEGEIQSKYVYNLWENINGFPVPDDFFLYTSYNLHLNMMCYKYTQNDIVKLFDFSKQSTVSKLLQENIPMYEMKDRFINTFNPLYIMKKVSEDKINRNEEDIKTLVPMGNFVYIKNKQNHRECVEA